VVEQILAMHKAQKKEGKCETAHGERFSSLFYGNGIHASLCLPSSINVLQMPRPCSLQ
jgi:hypothetical protein